jgi:hypothetical protein
MAEGPLPDIPIFTIPGVGQRNSRPPDDVFPGNYIDKAKMQTDGDSDPSGFSIDAERKKKAEEVFGPLIIKEAIEHLKRLYRNHIAPSEIVILGHSKGAAVALAMCALDGGIQHLALHAPPQNITNATRLQMAIAFVREAAKHAKQRLLEPNASGTDDIADSLAMYGQYLGNMVGKENVLQLLTEMHNFDLTAALRLVLELNPMLEIRIFLPGYDTLFGWKDTIKALNDVRKEFSGRVQVVVIDAHHSGKVNAPWRRPGDPEHQKSRSP